MAVNITIDPQIFEDIDTYGKQLVKMEDRVVRDLAKRAPTWVAQEVSSHYNIKKSELTKAGKGVKKPWGSGDSDERFSKAGVGISSGDTIASFTITYKGRLLTPFHFGMSPKLRPTAPSTAKKKKSAMVTTKNYTMRATIKSGSRQEIGHYKRKRIPAGPYSSSTGGLFMLNGGKVPAYRDSRNPKDIKVWKTLSVPEMVTNEKVSEAYFKRLDDETGKLLNKYYDMYIK